MSDSSTPLPVVGPPSEPIDAAELASALGALARAADKVGRQRAGLLTLRPHIINAQYVLSWWEQQQADPAGAPR